MWYVCDVLYAVLYVRVRCFVVRGCAVSRRYINVCNCDIFSVVNAYHDHLKFCVVCIGVVGGEGVSDERIGLYKSCGDRWSVDVCLCFGSGGVCREW